jgi:hypothetical protein
MSTRFPVGNRTGANKKLPKYTPETKICRVCFEVKAPEEFVKSIKLRDGLAYQCKKCQAIRARLRRAENPCPADLKNYDKRPSFLDELKAKGYNVKHHGEALHTGGVR